MRTNFPSSLVCPPNFFVFLHLRPLFQRYLLPNHIIRKHLTEIIPVRSARTTATSTRRHGTTPQTASTTPETTTITGTAIHSAAVTHLHSFNDNPDRKSLMHIHRLHKSRERDAHTIVKSIPGGIVRGNSKLGLITLFRKAVYPDNPAVNRPNRMEPGIILYFYPLWTPTKPSSKI